MRLEKTRVQVAEGELLVENHRLEVQLDDNSTTRRNKSRHYISNVITIQRAWRDFKRRQRGGGNTTTATPSGDQGPDRAGYPYVAETNRNDNNNMCPSFSASDEDQLSVGSESERSSGHQPMSVSSPEGSETNLSTDADPGDPTSGIITSTRHPGFSSTSGGGVYLNEGNLPVGGASGGDEANSELSLPIGGGAIAAESDYNKPEDLNLPTGGSSGGYYGKYGGGGGAVAGPGRAIIESEPNSVVSDYSEMAESIKEHLANVQIIRKEDLDVGNTMVTSQFSVQQKVPREPDETDEQYLKRLRKINYLSLAQEFAELKKIDAEALPFNLHKGKGYASVATAAAASPMSDGNETGTETDSSGRYLSESGDNSAAATPMEGYKDFVPPAPATAQTPQGSQAVVVGDNRRDADGVGCLDNAPLIGDCPIVTDSTDSVTSAAAVGKATSGSASNREAVSDNKPNHAAIGDASNNRYKDAKNAHQRQQSADKASPLTTNSDTVTVTTTPGGNKSHVTMATPASHVGDFDVYNIETTLPQMDWTMLEEQLRRAAEEEELKKQSRHQEREEIRRRLAMGPGEDDYYSPAAGPGGGGGGPGGGPGGPGGVGPGGGDRFMKRPNLQTRLQSGMNLQICFMNEATLTAEQDTRQPEVPPPVSTATKADVLASAAQAATSTGSGEGKEHAVAQSRNANQNNGPNVKVGRGGQPPVDEDFFQKQARLQAEAKMALAQVRPMAHMQLEVERQMRKKSPIAEIVGIPGLGEGGRFKLSTQIIQQMNIAQLQVVVNDLHAQIESLNEELVNLLVERDDLHMEQDSKLVDIEDLTSSSSIPGPKSKKKDRINSKVKK